MGRDWGSQSEWSQHSLLARFHNETWGGKSVRVACSPAEDPVRYRDILEFIYLCLCLGFEGRYKVMSQGRDEFERIVKQLYKLLSSEAEMNTQVCFIWILVGSLVVINYASKFLCAVCLWGAFFVGHYIRSLSPPTE